METLQCVVHLITRDCCMASIDPRDAYYTVPIPQEHREYWNSTGMIIFIINSWNQCTRPLEAKVCGPLHILTFPYWRNVRKLQQECEGNYRTNGPSRPYGAWPKIRSLYQRKKSQKDKLYVKKTKYTSKRRNIRRKRQTIRRKRRPISRKRRNIRRK